MSSTTTATTFQAARDAANGLARALEASEFEGWDPYDALTSPVLGAGARTALLRRVAIQSLKRLPVNLRPLLGIPRQRHTKALALCASAYVQLARLEEGRHRGEVAEALAQGLAERAIDRPDGGVGWGYDFDVQTRWGRYQRGQPNAVATAFAAHALLDVAEQGGDAAWEELARRSLTFMCSELVVERAEGCFFGYFPGADIPIHNASLLLSGVIARLVPDGPMLELGERALEYTLERQRPDGAWPYGEHPKLQWVDGFHTAYVLDCLALWDRRNGSSRTRDALRQGLSLYIERLFDPDGAPRHTLASRYPLDIHSASSALGTLSRLREYDDRALATAESVLRWTLGGMSRRDGHFAFQRHRSLRNSVPYIRWSDAHMLLALASYLSSAGLSRAPEPPAEGTVYS